MCMYHQERSVLSPSESPYDDQGHGCLASSAVAGVDPDSGHEEPVATLGTVRWVGGPTM